MCKILKVSRSGYYAYQGRQPSFRDEQNKILAEQIEQVYIKSRKTYGSPRIHATLKSEGIECGHNRVARLMREQRLVSKRHNRNKHFYRKNILSRACVSENILNRRFNVSKPNEVWVCDITSLWTGSGWLYLAVEMDLYSRRIIGWAMDRRMREELVVSALNMAVINRQPKKQLLHHSDQGSQYVSEVFRTNLKKNEMQCSMSRKGNCHDNAVIESFFNTLKTELTKKRKFKTREEAKAALFEYIEVFYNRDRAHSTLGYLSPIQYELKNVS